MDIPEISYLYLIKSQWNDHFNSILVKNITFFKLQGTSMKNISVAIYR